MNPPPLNVDLPFHPTVYEGTVQPLSPDFQPQEPFIHQWAQPTFDTQENIMHGSGILGEQGHKAYRQNPSYSFNTSGSQGGVWASSFDSDPVMGL